MIHLMFENLPGPHVPDIDPVTRTTQHDAETDAREVVSDSGESGFSEVSPDWCQRAIDRRGGSTPVPPVDAVQRKRMERSRLEAYAKKARCLASLTSALPQRLVPFTPVFPDSPLRYSPSTSDNVDVLKYFHPHVRDMRVLFEPDSHTYYVGGKPTNGSVTGMIHFFCKEFDAEATIQSMMSGYRWPREGYLRCEVNPSSICRLGLADSRLIVLYSAQPRDETQISSILRELWQHSHLQNDITQLCSSPEEIKEMWKRNAAEAAHYGTWMHALFEAHLNGVDVPKTSPEFRMFQNFMSNLGSSITAWRTEWVIFADQENLAGSIDFCARVPDGTFILVDWKRSAGLRMKFSSDSRMKEPLSDLRDCSGIQYRLQLNACRYILEKYYDLAVSRMFIVCCHPDNFPEPFVDDVPIMKAETEAMMACWRDVKGGSTASCDEVDKCSGASSCSRFFHSVQNSWGDSIGDSPFVCAVPRLVQVTDAMMAAWRDCKCGADREKPARSAKRQRLRSGVLHSYAAFFECYPQAVALLPNERDFEAASKRCWEKTMCTTRTLLRLVAEKYQQKNYIIYMFVHSMLRSNPDLQRRMEDLIPHPSVDDPSLHDWLGAMVGFLVVYCPRCCDARDRRRWSYVDMTAAGGTSTSADLPGGSLPQDVLNQLPAFFFSLPYLQALACTCSHVFRSMRRLEDCRNSCIPMDSEEFHNEQVLRQLQPVCAVARSLTIATKQLAMFQSVPANACIVWRVNAVVRHRATGNRVVGFLSDNPLLGHAAFDLWLPRRVSGIYIGVRQWQGEERRSYFRVDNLFRNHTTWSFGFNDRPTQPHSGRERYPILPDAVNRFQVQWNQHSFKISLNGDGVSSVSNRQQPLTAALAQVFVWVYCRPDAQGAEANLKPLPSFIQLNAEVKCALCAREFGIRDLRWAVCPDCGTWICRHHAQRSPTRLCPRCPNILLDYVGGKASANFDQVEQSQLLGFPQDLHQQHVDSGFPDSDRPGDVSGGSAYAADLPQDVLLILATCFACPDYLQRFQACSRNCRRAVLDPNTWQGQVIDMEPRGPNLAQFLRTARLVRLWSRADAVILPSGRLSKMPQMLQNMRIGWQLEYKAAQDVLSTLTSYLWESSRPLFGQAEFSVTMKYPATALIVGVRGTDMRTGMFQSTYCRFQRPFRESMSAAYGMYGEQPMPVTCQRGPQLPASATHHVKVAWSERRLTIWLDGCLQPSLQLRPQTPSGPRPHSIFFAKIFALPNSGRDDFLMRALPSKIEEQCVIKCHSCMYTSRLSALGCLLCDQCLHWFCFRHIQIAGPAAFCAPCAETVIDVLGGATALEKVTMACGAENASGLANSSACASQETYMPAIGERVDEEEAEAVASHLSQAGDQPAAETEAVAQQDERLTQELEAMLADDEAGKQNSLLQQARQRRNLPGAPDTMTSFAKTFRSFRALADQKLRDIVPMQSSEESSIPEHVARIRQQVLRRFPDMDEQLLRVTVGAVAVYRLRLTDIHLRELIMILWIVEGESHMRCHHGNIYFFHSGAFAVHRGVPPQGALARCKRFFLRLEGLFRLMGSPRLVTDGDVLDHVHRLFVAQNSSAQHLLNACEDAAKNHIPSAKSRQARSSRALGADEDMPQQDEHAHEGPTSRCQGTADSLARACGTLQNKLLDDKIFNLVVEWCESVQTRAAGVSYTDCAMLYDTAPGQHVVPARGVPEDNIYVHIPHPLLSNIGDPVIQAASDRLEKFYAETFWLNNDVPGTPLVRKFVRCG